MKSFESVELTFKYPQFVQQVPNSIGYPICWLILLLILVYLVLILRYFRLNR